MTTPGRITRRTLLRAAATATAATATAQAAAACSAGDLPIQVAVVWNAEELRLFRKGLRNYTAQSGRQLNVISAGDDLDLFLRARHLAGTNPDVAILSRPGLVTEYARLGWLAELTEDRPLTELFPGKLGDLLRYEKRLYGVWVKLAHKSLFWHLSPPDFTPPRSWDELVRLTADLAQRARRTGGPAPLSIGAADGWVLTDWFENVLADVATRDVYEALAHDDTQWQGPAVREALGRLADLWSIDGAFPGGGRRALLTQYAESVIQVVTTRQALMVFEGDFVEGVATTFAPKVNLGRFPFPKGLGSVDPLVVGGDAAVVFKDSRHGAELVRWLTGKDAFTPWIEAGGYLSPNLEVRPDSYRAPLQSELAAQISAARNSLRFDLSDQLPGSFTGSDGVGIWRIMQDFFADVTGGRVEGAVERTTRELARAAREAGIGQ